MARRVARDTGFTYVGPVSGSDTEFHMKHQAVPHARSRRSVPHTRTLRAHPHVSTAYQQTGYTRTKRGYKQTDTLLQTHKDSMKTKALPKYTLPNDPDFGKQWYLRNTGKSGGVKGLDLNLLDAWAMGYSGKGITTA